MHLRPEDNVLDLFPGAELVAHHLMNSERVCLFYLRLEDKNTILPKHWTITTLWNHQGRLLIKHHVAHRANII